jgi:hypothetical protein
MTKIPTATEKDILDWYARHVPPQSSDDEMANVKNKSTNKLALARFALAVSSVRRSGSTVPGHHDPLVASVASGLPYADWLLRKECVDIDVPEQFTASWYTTLSEGMKKQQQLIRGLKEHNVLMQFRFARYDVRACFIPGSHSSANACLAWSQSWPVLGCLDGSLGLYCDGGQLARS